MTGKSLFVNTGPREVCGKKGEGRAPDLLGRGKSGVTQRQVVTDAGNDEQLALPAELQKLPVQGLRGGKRHASREGAVVLVTVHDEKRGRVMAACHVLYRRGLTVPSLRLEKGFSDESFE